MAYIGRILSTLLGDNVVMRFRLEVRCYMLIPQVESQNRLDL